MFQHSILRGICVLIFVDQHVAQALLPRRTHVVVALEQLQRQPNEVVEIDGIERAQSRLIRRINIRRLAFACCSRSLLRLLGRESIVFRRRDEMPQRMQLIGLRCRRHEILDHAKTVVGIDHGKSPLQVQLRVLDLQKLQTKRMKCRDRHMVGCFTLDQSFRPLAHLARGFVGERNRSDFLRRQLLARDQVRDLFRDHPRLAGTGAGEHEQGAVAILDGGVLLRIQFHEGAHCARTALGFAS